MHRVPQVLFIQVVKYLKSEKVSSFLCKRLGN